MKFSVSQRTRSNQLEGRTSSRDLSITNYKILIVVLKSTRKRGGCDGEKKEALTLNLVDLCRSWKKLILRLSLQHRYLRQECLVVAVVVVDGEEAEEGSAVQAIYHHWDFHLLIYKICRERLLLCILCVNGQPFSTQ